MVLGKLFRTTVFKISLAYLAISAIGAGLVLGAVGWNMEQLIDERIAQTIDTDITGLSEQYAQGGIRRLVNIIQRRTRRPGAGLYLVTTVAGEPIAGNIASLPLDILTRPALSRRLTSLRAMPAENTGRSPAILSWRAGSTCSSGTTSRKARVCAIFSAKHCSLRSFGWW